MHGILFSVFAAAAALLLNKSPKIGIQYKKALQDLWIHPGRTFLVIFALFIGIWGAGTILASYTIMSRDLPENYLRTRPAHMILTSADFHKLDFNKFLKDSEIESAEFRDFSLQRIEVYPDQWLTLWLYGIQDFSSFSAAVVFPEEGEAPPPGSMVIERDGKNVSEIRTGSTPRVRIGKQNFHVPVSGIVFDPAQAPATQDAFIYAYTDQKTYRTITGERINQRLIVRIKDASSREDVISAFESISRKFSDYGIDIDSAEIPKFNEHPHQWQLNTILALEGVIGFLAFIMGMALVSRLINAIMAKQIRQVGIMKAVGASSRDLMRIYLFMVAVLGAAASAIAVPLSNAAAFAFSEFVAKKLNFNILTETLPLHVLLLLGSAGIFFPVIVTLPTVWKASKISILEALHPEAKIQGSIRKRKSAASSSFIFQLAVRNLLRSKQRMLITASMTALGVAIFSTGFNVRAALEDFLFESKDSMRYDIKVVLKEQIPEKAALLPFQEIRNIKSIESWNGGTGRIQSKVISNRNGIGIVALPPETNLRKWDIIKGRWLNSSGENEFVLNQQAAALFKKTEIGKIYTLDLPQKAIQAKLAGIIKEFDAPKIYINRKVYDQHSNPDQLINSLMISAEDRSYEKVLTLKKEIEKAAGHSDLSILFVMSHVERSLIIFNHLNILLVILIFLSLLVLLVSALGMASSTGISILERTREIGILRAIGATPGKIYSLFTAEGVIVNIAGIMAGLLTSLPLSWLASRFFGSLILGNNTSLDFTFSISGLLITFFITAGFGYLASRIPAGNALKISAGRALQYE